LFRHVSLLGLFFQAGTAGQSRASVIVHTVPLSETIHQTLHLFVKPENRMITTDSQASLALLTDLYQLTMAYGYWSRAKAEDTAVFHLFFRRSPFRGEYLVTAGLKPVVDFLSTFRFDADDLAFLETIEGNDGKPLFSTDFLGYLNTMKLSVDVDAVPEGTVMFPHEPLLRISGPILQCQLLETALLNIINFQSLIATKASRIC